MRRFLAFMFGLIFGITFLLGAFGVAAYSMLTVAHPNEIYTDAEKYLGDLGDVSLLQAINNVLELYNRETGGLSNKKLYSVGDFLADNNISTTDEDGNTIAFGVKMPKELLDAPLFEYFNTNVDENGHTGVQRALKQIKLSAVPAIVNMFATTDEDGNAVVSDEVIAKLDEHSVFDLFYGENEPINGAPQVVANLAVILEDITLADFVPALDQTNETDNVAKELLMALGQAPIGQLIIDLTGDENLLGMLNEDGSLAAVGQLTFADILGDSDPMIASLVGNVILADLVNENGELSITDALESVSLAGLVGATKRPADIQADPSNITSYYQTKQDGSRGQLIWSVASLSEGYFISLNAENDALQTTWYYAQLVCDNTHQTHQADCFDYMWYVPCQEDHDHAGEYQVTINGEQMPHAPIEQTSIIYTLATAKLSALFDDTGAINIDNFIAQFDDHSVAAIINQLLADNQSLDKLCALLDLDGINLSQLLADGGIDQVVSNIMDKPIADILDTLGIAGLDKVVGFVGHMSLNEILAGGYADIFVGDLLGVVKRDLTDNVLQPNGQIQSGIVTRKFDTTLADGTATTLYVAKKVVDEQDNYYISNDQLVWYEGQLGCQDETHTAFDHHDKNCFSYTLYQACTNEDAMHVHQTEDAFAMGTTYYTPANKLFNILGNNTVGDIMNNGTDSLIEQLTEIKLGELFEMLGQENAEGIMVTLSQFTIKELMDGAYNSLSLGDLLGYKRYQNDGIVESGSIVEFLDTKGALLGCVATIGSQMVKSADSQTWYNAKLACTEEHDHQIDCYEYLWYLACPDDCVEDHEHVIIAERAHTLAEGIFGVIVDVTIEQISNNPNSLVDKLYEVKLAHLLGDNTEGLMATLGEYTIKDLMDPSTLEEIGLADVLNYIRCDITTQVTPANGWDTDIIVDDGTTIVKYNSTTDQYAYFDTQDMRWYKAQMHCREQTHAHEIGCYGYIWYAECNNNSCEEHKDHFALQDKTYGQVEGIYAVLADLSIGDISNGTDIMDIITNRLTLGDIFGDGMPDMLKTLKDTPIADLESQLNTIKVGNLLGYSYNKELGRWEKDVGGVMQPLESVEKIIADKTLEDLKDFNSILEEIKLGDVLHPVPDMLSKLTDTPITQLGDKLDTLLVGDFLGYSHLSVDVAAIGWAEVADIDGLYEHTDGRLALLADDGIHYSAQLVCDDEHPHTIDCYDLEWFDKCEDGCDGTSHPSDKHFEDMDGNKYILVVGITSKLAGKTINQLSDLTELMNDLTLNDVFGEGKVPPMLQSIADEKIANLQTALNTIYVGEFLGYERGEKLLVCEIDDPAHIHNDDLGESNCCYQKKLACDDKSHVHWAMCYIYCYEWWQLDCDQNHNHSLEETPACYQKVTGITGKIANERLDTLSDIGQTIKTYTLHDVLGEDVPDMLKSIQYEPISNLNNSINNIYLGEFLGYTKGTPTGEKTLDCKDSHPHTDSCYYDNYNWLNGATPVDGMMAKIANKKVNNLGSVGDDVKSYTFAEIMGENSGDNAIIKELYDTPIGDIGTKMNTIMLGTAMGYFRKTTCGLDHTHTDACYYTEDGKVVWYEDELCTIKVVAPQSAFVNSTLENVGGDISSIKLGELIDISSSGSSEMLKALKDTPINGIAGAIDGMALGTSMGFVRKAVDETLYPTDLFVSLGEVVIKTDGINFAKVYDNNWYEATLTCKDSHSHNDNCYAFVWYEKCELDEHTHDGSCTTPCDIKQHSHSTDILIDGEKYYKVEGLNAKMSNLTIGKLGGQAVVDIVIGLTMKDMIDSGILDFSEDDKFKLSLLFTCQESSHKVTILSQEFTYDLESFFAYNAKLALMHQPPIEAEQFYKLTHGIDLGDDLTNEQIAHRDLWQDCTLTEFIEALLGNF